MYFMDTPYYSSVDLTFALATCGMSNFQRLSELHSRVASAPLSSESVASLAVILKFCPDGDRREAETVTLPLYYSMVHRHKIVTYVILALFILRMVHKV